MTDPNAFLSVDLDTLPGLRAMRHVVFSVGSNLGDRLEYLQGAVSALRRTPELSVTAVSSVYETEPVGPLTDQPAFYNLIVIGESTLPSLVLLERAQAIENAFHRVREVPGGPRTLDLDLIVVGDRVKRSLPLTLPHPRAHERAFVLVPWLEVEPDAELVGRGSVAELLRAVDTAGVDRRPELVVE